MEKIRVGVIGCGAIGTEICKAIDELGMELKFLMDRHIEKEARSNKIR
jgi:predicted dinucleotide-utilizing enzyme